MAGLNARVNNAAFDRIASCLGLQLGVFADHWVGKYISVPTLRRLWRINALLELSTANEEQNESNEALQVWVCYLGLVELAAKARFVDVWEWYATPLLKTTVESVSETLGSKLEEAPFSCVKALMARLSNDTPSSAPPDPDAFAAFESYLALTRSLRSDDGVFRCLHETHTVWKPGFDRGALFSPRHLAEAIATDRVGAVPMNGISGLPRSLQGYEWLASIVTRLGGQDELRQGILVHANWSHGAWVFRHRTDEWATAMSEWSESRDFEGESEWQKFRERVFDVLETAQAEFGLDQTANVNALSGLRTTVSLSWDPAVEETLGAAEQRVDELLLAARYGAARRYLQRVLVSFSSVVAFYLRKAEFDEVLNDRLVGRFLRLATRLADLGAVDSAAALVVPHMDGIALVGHGVSARAVVSRVTRVDMVVNDALLQLGVDEMSQVRPAEAQVPTRQTQRTAPPDETVRAKETLLRREL